MSTSLDLSQASAFFEDATKGGDASWHCKATGFFIHGGILAEYRQMMPLGGEGLAGLTLLGLPLENERQVGPTSWVQRFERGILAHDGPRAIDNPPGSHGPVYLLQTTTQYVLASDAHAREQALQQQIDQQAQMIQQLRQQVADLQAGSAGAHDAYQKLQALKTALSAVLA